MIEHENFSHENGHVCEDGEPIFYIGAIRDAQELRAVVCAWRTGRNNGETLGRALQQHDIARALGLQPHVFQKAEG